MPAAKYLSSVNMTCYSKRVVALFELAEAVASHSIYANAIKLLIHESDEECCSGQYIVLL